MDQIAAGTTSPTARVRLTAEELGITEQEYAALLWTRDALDPDILDQRLPRWLRFEMKDWIRKRDWNHSPAYFSTEPCGTNACIGGTMAMHMAGLTSIEVRSIPPSQIKRPYSEVAGGNFSTPLHHLFFSFQDSKSSNRRAATAAIDEFLSGNTGNPWRTRSVRSGHEL